jgi:hypothetical protein
MTLFPMALDEFKNTENGKKRGDGYFTIAVSTPSE